MRSGFFLLVMAAIAAGCGGGSSSSQCIPGDSKPCAGPGPCAGYQVCRADGTYDACNCGSGAAGSGGSTANRGGAGGAGGTAGTGGTGGVATGGSAGGAGGAATGGSSGAGGMAGAGGTGGAAGAAGTSGGGGSGGVATCVGSGGGGAPADGGAGASGQPADAGRDAYVSDGPAADPQFQSFCAAVRAAMVARNERCFGLTHGQAETWVNIDPCAAWGSGLDGPLKVFDFDATNAAACAGALSTLSCGVSSPPAVCAGVLRGLIPTYTGLGTSTGCTYARQLTINGDTTPLAWTSERSLPAAFSLFTECVAGSVCVRHEPLIGAPFICRPLSQLGATCTAALGCSEGTCDSKGNCAAPRQAGETCAGDADCAQGMYCGAETCVAKRASGACSSSVECLPPAFCRSGTCADVRPGDPCTMACTVSGAGGCGYGQYCAPDATCHSLPMPGERCARPPAETTGWIPCLIGNCNPVNLVCELADGTGLFTICVDSPANATCGPNRLCVDIATMMPDACTAGF